MLNEYNSISCAVVVVVERERGSSQAKRLCEEDRKRERDGERVYVACD